MYFVKFKNASYLIKTEMLINLDVCTKKNQSPVMIIYIDYIYYKL